MVRNTIGLPENRVNECEEDRRKDYTQSQILGERVGSPLRSGAILILKSGKAQNVCRDL